jgi:predicted phage-related endonuclease
MTITIHDAFEQGSQQWLDARCGLLTASEVKLILSPTLKVANNDKTRAHAYELAAQRITQYVEPRYIGDDMLRGHEDEVRARLAYSEAYADVAECGFITNDSFGFTLGYSPDGLVGDDGLIECKSRCQKLQVQTIVNGVPDEHMLQLQTGLLVTGRKWLDYISYSGGMPMATMRVEPDAEIQDAIVTAATAFEQRIADVIADYHANLKSMRWLPTERVVEQEMHL